MFYSFFKQKGMHRLLRTSRSFRQLLIENYKAAIYYAEEALDHIHQLPFKMSQIDLPGPVFFVRLSGERVYTSFGGTLYVYSVKEPTQSIATLDL
jgi:hypothetical protein